MQLYTIVMPPKSVTDIAGFSWAKIGVRKVKLYRNALDKYPEYECTRKKSDDVETMGFFKLCDHVLANAKRGTAFGDYQ